MDGRFVLWFFAMGWVEDRWVGVDRVFKRFICGFCLVIVLGSEVDIMF